MGQLNYRCDILEEDIKKLRAGNEALKRQVFNAQQKIQDAEELLSRADNVKELITDKFEIYAHEIEYLKK